MKTHTISTIAVAAATVGLIMAVAAGQPQRFKQMKSPRVQQQRDTDRPLLSAESSKYELIADFDFEGGGGAASQGWTGHDLTASETNYFHVDGFIGLAPGYGPLEGFKSLWCGARSSDHCLAGTFLGYGNSWNQAFYSTQFPVSGVPSVSYIIQYDCEQDYDFGYLEYFTNTATWNQLASYTGTGLDTVSVTIPSDHAVSYVKLRFRFESDVSVSDQDGNYDSNGALIIDDIVVKDGAVVIDQQDFETEAVFDTYTQDGNWAATLASGYGEHAGLFDGSTVLQEDTLIANSSYLWGFFASSPDDYTCGGHPAQAVVPHERSTDPKWIDNEIRSPEFDLSRGRLGRPFVSVPDSFRVEYDAYLHLPLSAGVFSRFRYRFRVGDCWEEWESSTADYSPSPKWYRIVREAPINPSATSLQVALECQDLCEIAWQFGGGCICHTNAPLFDNVSVSVNGLEVAPSPVIASIVDIPDDQGRQASISWYRSLYDAAYSDTTVHEYAIYRRVDDSPDEWHFIKTAPARGEDSYAVVVPTLVDSTSGGGVHYSTFRVRALSDTAGIHFDSQPDSGYSVDNIAPEVPDELFVFYAESGNRLGWMAGPDTDVVAYRIYRDLTSDFTPSPARFVHSTLATEWVDRMGGGQYHYKVCAVDAAGNESEPATAASDLGGNKTPDRFALYPNVPNPFNPTTTIVFDVPVNSRGVSLRIYDAAGRLVRTLVDRNETAGRKSVTWDGTNVLGQRATSGVYFYRLQAAGFEQTRKMVLLK